MKPLILLILGVVFALPGQSLQAQMDDGYIYNEDQSSPYEFYASFPGKRQSLDSTIQKFYDKTGTPEIGSPRWEYYRRSADGLRDTIYVYNYFKGEIRPSEKTIRWYDLKGNLLEFQTFESMDSASWKYGSTYTYDSQNRVIRCHTIERYYRPEKHITVAYDYENHTTTCWDITMFGDSIKQTLTIHPTDSGYMGYETFEITDRETGKIRKGGSDSLRVVFDSQKRQIKWELNTFFYEVKTYEYFDNGYVMMNARGGMEKHYYDQRGYKVKQESFHKTLLETEYYFQGWRTYQYYLRGEVPGGVEPVEAPTLQAYGVQGAVVVEARKAANVQVYNLMGRLISQQSVGLARTEIPLPRGIYIVTVGGQSQKVVVR